ncbi:MAG: putative quinol monooxygenase [Gemmatimonadales bacterium]|nr:putative quinol monooxygenase [Gemmatimonadales bacterium]
MFPSRRDFLAAFGATALVPLARFEPSNGGATMYGLIGKITTTPGQRDAFAAILLEGTNEMPGCLSYVVAIDPAEPDALWVTEVWDSKASHEASLALPAVRAAIAKGRAMIAGFSNRVETTPIGGAGLPGSR